MLGHVVGLFTRPVSEWHRIRDKLENDSCQYTALVFLLALIPPVCGFIGTTQFGWKSVPRHRSSSPSAAP